MGAASLVRLTWLFVLLAGVGCASDVVSGDPPAGGDGGVTPTVDAPPADPTEPAPPPVPWDDAEIAALGADVAGVLGAVAYTHSVKIEDEATGAVLFASSPDLPLLPASNTKLVTTAAALELLGPDASLGLRAYGVLDGAGRVADLLVLAEHDFSLASDFYGAAPIGLARFADSLARAGVRSTGPVTFAGEVVYDGSSVGTLDVAGDRAAAAGALALALDGAGIAHGAIATSAELAPPAGETPLVEHAPLNLAVGGSPLNVRSHNELADLLARRLGWRIAGTSTLAAGGGEMTTWLASTGVPATGVTFSDGSGLSRANRLTASALVGLFRFMLGSPEGRAWRRSFAIAGVRGTLGARLADVDTLGRVWGKTGSLRDTIALSGLYEQPHLGRRILFSVLLNDVTDQARARGVADDVVRAIAARYRGLARPERPRILTARGGDARVEVTWAPAAGAEGYVVWLSTDGSSWPRSAARWTTGNRLVAGELVAGATYAVRVSARAPDGHESDPSTALVATAIDGTPDVVLVDGNDRWLDEPADENVLGEAHDFLIPLALASPGRTLASAHHAAVTDGTFATAGASVAIWAMGEESDETTSLDAPAQAAIAAARAAGTSVIVSGSEVLWDLAELGSPADQAFVAGTLAATYVGDDAGTAEVRGEGPLADLPVMSFFAPDDMVVSFPDLLSPGAGAIALLGYTGGEPGAAAVGVGGAGGVVTLGFPIEAMPRASHRALLLARLYAYLGAPSPR